MDPIIKKPVASKKDVFVDVIFHRSDSKSDVEYTYVEESKNETIGSNDPPSTTAVSKWGIGWQTVTLMVSFYVLALIIALMHLTMFLSLDGKKTDQEGTLKQTHVAALSTLLVTLFGLCLTISLGVAFTQYLWYLLRHKPMTVDTIETLFGIRANPLLLFHWSGWEAAPIACTMATIAFLLAIVKIFPPGALTVESRRLDIIGNTSVPTLKTDNIGNGSWVDAVGYSLATSKVYVSLWRYGDLSPVVGRLASTTLSTGEVLSATSPCGTNCTYEITFEGPHMICSNFTETVVRTPTYAVSGNPAQFDHYSAGLYPDNLEYVPARTNASDRTYSDLVFPFLSINITWPIGGLSNRTGVNDFRWIVANRTRHECHAGIVTYDLKVNFENGVRTLSYTKRDDVRKLSDIYVTLPGHRVGSMSNIWVEKEWTDVELAGLKFTNMWALFDSVTQALRGWYPMFANRTPSNSNSTAPEETLNITLTNGSVIAYQPAVRGFDRLYFAKLRPMNGTVIEATRLNRNRDELNLNARIDIDVSYDLLNEMVANTTFSVLFSMPVGDLETSVTTWSSHNFYQFSYPLNLYMPYGASLLLTLPFLILGFAALQQNGVPAMDGSFLQLLMTTTASKKLNMKAAGGCLGGDNNVPEALRHEKILFGELAKSDDDLMSPISMEKRTVRCAGFGLEDEVIPLRKQGRYGLDSEG